MPKLCGTSLIVNFSTTHTLWYFTRWHFTQHPCWSESFTGQNPLSVALFETSTIRSNCFQDHWLSPQTNMKLFNVFYPHSHVFWETFQKVTYLITTQSQTCLTMKFLSDRLPKSICILLVYVVPINSFKLSSIAQSHTCTTSRFLSF